MKRFLSIFFTFIFPFLLLLAAIEIFVLFYPSTFNKKADYLKRHAGEIKTLILGSSHDQNSLNPEYFHTATLNLANAGQDVQLDSALFFTYIKKLTALKQVILEIDYLTLEEKNDSTYFRLPWYYRFYDIKLYPVALLNRLSVYSSSPSFFNKLILDEINPKKTKYRLNKYGFILNDFPGVMEDLHYDTAALAQSAPERLKDKHTIISIEHFIFNRRKLNAIIQYCLANNIRVILISNPMYTTYLQNEIGEKNVRRKDYTDSLLGIPGIRYLDFEKSPLFGVHDFKNDDHLNSNGARRFSLMIDSLVNAGPH